LEFQAEFFGDFACGDNIFHKVEGNRKVYQCQWC
jgi:hypothetical protein